MQRRYNHGCSCKPLGYENFPLGGCFEFEEILLDGVPVPLVEAFDTETGEIWLLKPDSKGRPYIDGGDVARGKRLGKIEVVRWPG